MPPNSDFVPKSTLGIVPPSSRTKKSHNLTVDVWLEEKQDTDGAEGLWRVHDGIYDLTEFVDKHPGGSEWLSLTKGTDITEAFEAHHLTEKPEEVLKKYYKRNAKAKRNFPFSFEEDGFYKTLKRAIMPHLKTIPKQPLNTTNFMTDALLFFLFLFSVMAVKYWSYGIAIIAGIFLGMVTIAAHNYIHRRDNFRMYYFQFSLMQVREFRISHVLSHHLHTNTIDDLEISLLEPFFQYLPIEKNLLQKIRTFLAAPLIWIGFFPLAFVRRCIDAYRFGGKNLKMTDLTSFILPLVMYALGGQTLWHTIGLWLFIILVGSLHFALVGLHAAHHHPDIFHDGDEPRVKQKYDWGLSQLDAVMDRKEISGSHFLVLTNFGDHCLHHLFPTLDHGALEHLYPIFNEVLDKFDVNVRLVSQVDTFVGAFQQLIKTKPNTEKPDLKKYVPKSE